MKVKTSIKNEEDIKESYFGIEATIDTSKDLQNVEQDEVKELTYSHTDGWSLVCYSRNGPSLEELNCSCCTVHIKVLWQVVTEDTQYPS